MAAIYAYHHLTCPLCQRKRNLLHSVAHLEWEEAVNKLGWLSLYDAEDGLLDSYEESFEVHKYGSLADKWFDCTCSVEWLIIEDTDKHADPTA